MFTYIPVFKLHTEFVDILQSQLEFYVGVKLDVRVCRVDSGSFRFPPTVHEGWFHVMNVVESVKRAAEIVINGLDAPLTSLARPALPSVIRLDSRDAS